MSVQNRMARPLAEVDPDIYRAIQHEVERQHGGIELIASENFTSEAILEATSSVFTNKYAEGYPGKRYYGGCEFTDVVENLARDRAKKLFGAEHANVQPHSGSQANQSAYSAVLKPGDTILGMNLAHGGHLTHGHPLNFSGKTYNVVPYGVRKDDEVIDYDELARLAEEHKPKMIIAGASAYSRIIDFARFRAVADSVGAIFLVDMAHFSGLVAAGIYPNPCDTADIVTSTTHKTLRGPRSGLILCREKYAAAIDKVVFPGVQGGPLVHIVAAKAVCFLEAMSPDFRVYQQQVVANARALAAGMAAEGYRIVSGGTDSHLFLVDVFSKGLRGKEAEQALDKAHITVNKNAIPFDSNPPLNPSGIRLGSPAVTTRGFQETQMAEVASLIAQVLRAPADEANLADARGRVHSLTERFPLYSLEAHYGNSLTPRILIDARHLKDFGFGTYTRNLLRSLARTGQDAEFFVVAHHADHDDLKDLPFNFRLIGYERSDRSEWDNIAFPWLVRGLHPDVSHIPLNMVPLLMPRPYVVTVHDLSSLIFEKKAGWRHDAHFYRVRRGLMRAEQILAVSSATARDLSSLLAIPTSKVKVVYGGADPRFSLAEDPERKRILERYQVNYPFLLYSGNIRPQKNIPRLVEAFALLKGELEGHPLYRDLRLVIIGDEVSKSPAVRQAVTKTRVASSVRFLGFVPIETLRAFYEAATAFVFPSLYEGFGLPPLEAMASGTPVVAASTSSVPEVVGDAAVTVNPESVFDIARGIKEVLLDANLRRRLIEAGRQQVGRFNWDVTAREVFAAYTEVASRKRPR